MCVVTYVSLDTLFCTYCGTLTPSQRILIRRHEEKGKRKIKGKTKIEKKIPQVQKNNAREKKKNIKLYGDFIHDLDSIH